MGFKIVFWYIFLQCFNLSSSFVSQSKYEPEMDLENSFSNPIVFAGIISHIVNSGTLMLINFVEKIENQYEITINTTILKDNSDEYSEYVVMYSGFVSNQIVNCDLEREFYALHLIECVNELLINQSHILLQNIVSSQTENIAKLLIYDVAGLLDYIETVAIDVKRDNLAYICEKLNICRRFPAYSDYIVDILNEIIVLSDKKFQAAIILLKETIKMKTAFIKTIMNDELAQSIGLLFSSLKENLPKTRYRIIVLKNIIRKKHIIFKSKSGEIKKRKKAMRILIDIFDKTFERLKEEAICTEVNEIVNGLRDWTKSDDVDLQKIFMDYIANVVDVLESVLLDKALRYEVIALIELLVKGSTKYDVAEDLLTKGSEFVKRGKPIIPIPIISFSPRIHSHLIREHILRENVIKTINFK